MQTPAENPSGNSQGLPVSITAALLDAIFKYADPQGYLQGMHLAPSVKWQDRQVEYAQRCHDAQQSVAMSRDLAAA